ncbi:UDP-glycosyltransferase 88B1-like [Panicum miliaceum]|uniref:Glycosyltransferase n=1 Tax=Panicum miliaceum TaxID=4540 RepID=A0A3L6SWU3_PANMI|nr:UDP-glycosyltransferase 88B1-like [Panicum miliaceum]
MARKTVVLFPGVGVGHLAPMLELAKAFLRHGGGAVDVAVAVVEPPVMGNGFAATVARTEAANASVAFHVLPPPPPASGGAGEPGAEQDPLAQMVRFLRATNAPLRDLLRSLPSVGALVLDMFCGDALDVAEELGVPAYFFFPSGAAGLAVFLALPARRASMSTSFAGLGASTVLSFPGAPPFKVSEMAEGVSDDGEACQAILRIAARMPDARGILINSFESLEPRAVRALRDGLCVPDRPTPPVYLVGPLVSPGGDKEHTCLQWLDAQPDRSVVFLCFGSMGAFPRSQLAEIAVGLERSGQRFLWVVRSPPSAGEPSDDDDLDALLPAGFLERTRDRGLAVRPWAPQADVLRHRAAGAFVTHCGWNSTLEGVAAGLPLLCWPLYAEQKMNRVRIVEDMRLGVGIAAAGDGAVSAEEVEAKVRWVMGDSDGARALRERATAARDSAAEAVVEGGPADVAFVEFLKDLLEASQDMHAQEL